MINLETVKNLCMLNCGSKQCRYLSKIENENKFVCLKKTKNKIIIDSALKDTKNKEKRYPIGDNCCGMEFFELV